MFLPLEGIDCHVQRGSRSLEDGVSLSGNKLCYRRSQPRWVHGILFKLSKSTNAAGMHGCITSANTLNRKAKSLLTGSFIFPSECPLSELTIQCLNFLPLSILDRHFLQLS